MKLVFDHRMFRHINEMALKESGRSSRFLVWMENALQWRMVHLPLAVFERFLTIILCLPIPLYSGLVYYIVTNMRGLPHFPGMYVRALYYRGKLGSMAANVFIDQNVFFAYPKGVNIEEFSYIDKSVIIMSKNVKIGRRVHLAPKVFVSGGGDFEVDDYAGVATSANIITSTELLKDGIRASGPMVKPDQRQVVRGKVHLKKDCFVAVGVTILPNVTMGEGSVAGVGVTLSKDTEAWAVYANSRPKRIGTREPVRFSND